MHIRSKRNRIKSNNYPALAVNGGPKTLENPGPHYVWPRVTKELEKAVVDQLHKNISIYDRSGVFAEFETEFASLHQKKHALLFNSGTSAIHAMYVAAGLGPGDEVICPAYTFFATVSPLLSTGAIPVLCDCDHNGNIDPSEIEKKVTPKTKAIVVTHMWGIPCQMDKIVSLCERNRLLLLEDCSHAHGAQFGEKLVGSFGNISAWSLQGQKLVTGGEGGVLVTDSRGFYEKALLFGHYNKRCRQEINRDSKLYPYCVTGLGLKLRAHPLAVAIALNQLKELADRSNERQKAAKILLAAEKRPGLMGPELKGVRPAWYALIFRYDPKYFNGLPISKFHDALLAEGLTEADLPSSTCPLNLLPLFQRPWEVFPAYNHPMNHFAYSPGQFPKAERFYSTALKFPVWAHKDEEIIVRKYASGLRKVIRHYKEING